MFDKTMFCIIRDGDQNVQRIVVLRLPSPRMVHSLFPCWVPTKQDGDVLISYSIWIPIQRTNFREMFTWCLREQTYDRYRMIDLYHVISFHCFQLERIDFVCFVCVETKLNTETFILMHVARLSTNQYAKRFG